MKGILWAVLESPFPLERRYSEGSPHHITLRYGIHRWVWRWLEGKRFTAIARTVAHNARIQAAVVTLPWWVYWVCTKPIPHITISWVPEAKPVEANAMLLTPENQEDISIHMNCVIAFEPFKR